MHEESTRIGIRAGSGGIRLQRQRRWGDQHFVFPRDHGCRVYVGCAGHDYVVRSDYDSRCRGDHQHDNFGSDNLHDRRLSQRRNDVGE